MHGLDQGCSSIHVFNEPKNFYTGFNRNAFGACENRIDKYLVNDYNYGQHGIEAKLWIDLCVCYKVATESN